MGKKDLNESPKPAIYLGLLHYPVYNKNRDVIATAVTNIDVHDIARSSRTYGIEGVFIVTPIEQQRALIGEIIAHWTSGAGARHNAARAEAFQRVSIVDSLESAQDAIAEREQSRPVTLVTSAKPMANTMSYVACRKAWQSGVRAPQLLLFGTGWGMADEIVEAADVRLPSVEAAYWVAEEKERYNHLSVRSAVAIILDRLLGNRKEVQ